MSIEDDLIRQAQAGDKEAFCRLAETYERRIYSLALHYSRNHQDAEDLSQEVWLRSYLAIGTFRGEASFYSWLRKIMINCFLNHRRAKSFGWRREISQLFEAASGEDIRAASEATINLNLQTRLVVQQVMQALAEVTPQQRMTFLLKHHEGMSYEEIAKALGCSTGAVKKSVSRTITKLRQRLRVNEESPTYVSFTANIESGV